MIRSTSKEEEGMKNRKHQNGHGSVKEEKEFFQPEDNDEGVIGTKVLYNWLYQQEEEDYYSSAKVSGFFPEFAQQEALFVEY